MGFLFGFISTLHSQLESFPTGGNVGLGRETCKELLLKCCTVWLAACSQSKAEETIAELKNETGKEALFLSLDLSDLKNVKEAAENFKR